MLFKNAYMCDYSGEREGDIRVENTIITDIGNLSAKNGEDVIDINGKLLMPAMIDLNVAPKSLSLSRKNLLSLAPKALKGGVGSILLYPHTTPSCSANTSIELIKSIDKESPIALIPSCNPLNKEGRLSDIATLHHSGAKAIFVRSDIDSHLLLKIAQYAQMLDILLICFCQDSSLSFGVINEGELATKLGLPSIPPFNQYKEVAKIAEMLCQMPIKLLFDALSFKRSLEIVDSYKSLHTHTKARFYTQSPIHHLSLDETLCDYYNTAGKINPPLVSISQQAELIESFALIDTLTSLQCADSSSQKDQVFELASFGVDELEHYFSLLFTFIHKAHKIPLSEISKRTSHTPAQILGLNKGALKEGLSAEFIVIDRNAQYEINNAFSPYHKRVLYGRVDGLFNAKTFLTPHQGDNDARY